MVNPITNDAESTDTPKRTRGRSSLSSSSQVGSVTKIPLYSPRKVVLATQTPSRKSAPSRRTTKRDVGKVRFQPSTQLRSQSTSISPNKSVNTPKGKIAWVAATGTKPQIPTENVKPRQPDEVAAQTSDNQTNLSLSKTIHTNSKSRPAESPPISQEVAEYWNKKGIDIRGSGLRTPTPVKISKPRTATAPVQTSNSKVNTTSAIHRHDTSSEDEMNPGHLFVGAETGAAPSTDNPAKLEEPNLEENAMKRLASVRNAPTTARPSRSIKPRKGLKTPAEEAKESMEGQSQTKEEKTEAAKARRKKEIQAYIKKKQLTRKQELVAATANSVKTPRTKLDSSPLKSPRFRASPSARRAASGAGTPTSKSRAVVKVTKTVVPCKSVKTSRVSNLSRPPTDSRELMATAAASTPTGSNSVTKPNPPREETADKATDAADEEDLQSKGSLGVEYRNEKELHSNEEASGCHEEDSEQALAQNPEALTDEIAKEEDDIQGDLTVSANDDICDFNTDFGTEEQMGSACANSAPPAGDLAMDEEPDIQNESESSCEGQTVPCENFGKYKRHTSEVHLDCISSFQAVFHKNNSRISSGITLDTDEEDDDPLAFSLALEESSEDDRENHEDCLMAETNIGEANTDINPKPTVEGHGPSEHPLSALSEKQVVGDEESRTNLQLKSLKARTKGQLHAQSACESPTEKEFEKVDKADHGITFDLAGLADWDGKEPDGSEHKAESNNIGPLDRSNASGGVAQDSSAPSRIQTALDKSWPSRSATQNSVSANTQRKRPMDRSAPSTSMVSKLDPPQKTRKSALHRMLFGAARV